MTKTLKITGIIAGMVLFAVFAMTQYSFANPSKFSPPVSTATATTSQQYMTFGVGTTTLTFDSYYSTTFSDFTKTDEALLLFQFYSTSTVSIPIVNVAVEYSNDGVDWYPETRTTTANASSSVMTGTYADYQFPIATSTLSTRNYGTASTTPLATSFNLKSLKVDTPTRYIRFVFYMPSGGGKGALWASVQPVKENK